MIERVEPLERSPGDHKRRWGSLRLYLYLCGDENGAGAEDGEDDDDGTVSARSFETCAMTQDAQAPAAADQRRRDVNGGAHGHAEQVHVQWSPGERTKPFTEDEAATLIQSAFRRFMERGRLLQEELRRSSGQECCYGEALKSPASACTIAASVEVQVGESLSNLRLSDDGASVSAQHRAGHSQKPRPQVFRAKEEWDDSTLSSNVLRMRIQSKMEATTRRERALAYAFSQQLRSGGTKKRSSRSEQGEFNVGWSWLERWMATRQAEPGADDSASKNATDAGSAVAGRRVVVVRRRQDVAVEEKESCGSNDVSAISFDGSSAGGRSGLSCYRPGKNRLRGPRNLPRRKVAAASSDHHRLQQRSHKVSKKARQREEKQQLQKDHQVEAEAYDPRQPPTDY
ncbi:hypothetical protein CFC21_110470 [Triticum aestivum]|uniref:Protein IQ-DOMAIN 1 n=2 Tax=Triticum aestivum TaxID=4565 RepID=A0A9R1MN30_WHEAT|nr:protein IQ-DOMAIN 33 isoform X2 [Aegilops tauschii subsp. strangulata]XP_040250404.1 protein IQ-DOMAIN 33 isoform X2 [Aegilops tauschii subsp. strangulata]XP_044436980.1 protein IQ-DOMAIN 33-like isoform X2 [Triticum aestivum]KAF7110347.1 hypothetical protein CFC21_110470 [Triticum aestivum]